MSGIGVLSIVSGGLQLFVPSYGLRLVRRFGAESVGWFLVVAFASLGLLHAFGAGRPAGLVGSPLTTEAIAAVGALLLLVGMGHLESLCSERQAGRSREQGLHGQLASQLRSETSALEQQNQELLAERALCEERLAALEASVGRYHSLFDDSPQAMWIFDLRTHRILAVNKAALRLYGFAREEFLARTGRDLMVGADAGRFTQYAAMRCTGNEAPLCLWQHRKHSAPLPTEIIGLDLAYDGAPARLLLVTDFARRQEHETELRNAVRFEVIRQVAGGFAHHFNNLLAIIEGSVALLRDDRPGARCAEPFQHISVAVNRAAWLTRQLLSVAGQRVATIVPVELNGVLTGMHPQLQQLVGEGVTIQTVYSSGLPPVLADAQLVEQLMVNLVLNARDAMPDGGTVYIQTAAARRETTLPGSTGQGDRTDFVRLSVRDTGCGMTPEVQARLFEPFFTTKDVGRGTGLGLASVYGALRQQAGWIEFTSQPGQGTEARVFLPCGSGSAQLSAAKDCDLASLGTVLLVEPDDRVRGMVRCVLGWNGYRVIEAAGSAVAMMLWESQAANIDLLFVDASLGDGMTGPELARRLSERKPSLKVVLGVTSSHAHEGMSPQAAAGSMTLRKPFTPERLLQAVRTSIPGGAASARHGGR